MGWASLRSALPRTVGMGVSRKAREDITFRAFASIIGIDAFTRSHAGSVGTILQSRI